MPGNISGRPKVTKVERIYNPKVFGNFKKELRKNIQMYPNENTWSLFKMLFHGTKETSPHKIFGDDHGLDPAHAKMKGLYG